ncbi:unnamed protein product [Auanema sp. JU1783]|nr:unnamed protein product [Auanema sp. JU1783]
MRYLDTLIREETQLAQSDPDDQRANTLQLMNTTGTKLKDLDNMMGQLINYLRYKMSKQEKVFMILQADIDAIEIKKAILFSIFSEYITDAYPSPPIKSVDDLLAITEIVLNRNNITLIPTTTVPEHTAPTERPPTPTRHDNEHRDASTSPQVVFENIQPPSRTCPSTRSLPPTYTATDDADGFYAPHPLLSKQNQAAARQPSTIITTHISQATSFTYRRNYLPF